MAMTRHYRTLPLIGITVFLATVSVHGFLAASIQKKSSTTRLFYTDDRSTPKKVLTIPVLGPIPGGNPLLVGEDVVLVDPTPMQWHILEEALHHHQEFLQETKDKNNDNNNKLPQQNSQQQPQKHVKVAGIEAAPLVAFMDEVTSMYAIHGDKRNSKYATIAAVVGISTTSGGATTQLDTSSSRSFMESLMQVFEPTENGSKLRTAAGSSIRLVGIGRAALSDFYSQLPSSAHQHDTEGYLQIDSNNDNSNHIPIPMAQVRLLADGTDRSAHFIQHYHRSGHSSPVHALAEMSSLASRITSLHEDRKRLVRGLVAAQARLAAALDNDLEDHDGLGNLASGFVLDDSSNHHQPPKLQQAIETLLTDFPADDNDPLHRHSYLSQTSQSRARLLEMENYGMGISSASFAALPGLTVALAEKLQPYHSPETCASEEHYYEVFSFMGTLSLSKFVKVQDLDWALKCTNTIERMQWVYEWMWSHKKLLEQASEEVSQELRDCGEECTDLW